MLGSDWIIYGTAQGAGSTGTGAGSTGTGAGAIFALDAGLPKPRPWAKKFGPQSGPVGTQVRIWGQNLLSASVQFNGVPTVAVSSSGPNYVWATVQVGATTGRLQSPRQAARARPTRASRCSRHLLRIGKNGRLFDAKEVFNKRGLPPDCAGLGARFRR